MKLLNWALTLTLQEVLLATEFSEYKIGESPDIDVIIFDNGRQLVFMDNILTDKHSAVEIEQAMNTRRREATN